MSKKFYLDIECDGLLGQTLIQIGCVSEDHETFNGFVNPPYMRPLPLRCTNLTGFFNYKGRLFQNGIELDSSPRVEVLKRFREWLRTKALHSADKSLFYTNPLTLICPNGYGYDFRILSRHYSQCGLILNPTIRCCDSLSIIKKYYSTHPVQKPAGARGYSLDSLADYYKITNSAAHNGLADSITLKKVCDYFIFNHSLPLDHFTSPFRELSTFQAKNA